MDYALCGYSFGGLVAYEIAARLAAEGGIVNLLAMIDTRVYPDQLLWLEILNHFKIGPGFWGRSCAPVRRMFSSLGRSIYGILLDRNWALDAAWMIRCS